MTQETTIIPNPSVQSNSGEYADVEYTLERVSEYGLNISHLEVPNPSNRRQGKGSEFLTTLLNEAKNDDARYIVANVGGGEDTADFFRANGFTIVEMSPGGMVTAEKTIS